MANLRNLLTQRAAQTDVPIRDGRMFVFSTLRRASSCFCWISPGTGTAIIEVWGAGGGGGTGMCCGMGLPGNSGAYSRTTIPVTSSSFVCGQVGGGATAAATVMCGCHGCCSHIGIAPAGTLTRCVVSQGGTGGHWMCNLGCSHYCMYFAAGYCASPIAGYATGCGKVCNIGITNMTNNSILANGVITAACACGGDLNAPGGISALDICICDVASNASAGFKAIHAYPAGLRGLTADTMCLNYCEVAENGAASHQRGEATFETQFTRMIQHVGYSTRYFQAGCAGYVDCGCYGYTLLGGSSGIIGAGYGSQSGITGGTTNGCGSHGGPGLVKITFI